MYYLKISLLILGLILYTSCNNVKKLEGPPPEYVDTWVQYSGKPFYDMIPAKFSIGNSHIFHRVKHFEGENVSDKNLQIREVKKLGEEITIFCGPSNKETPSNIRYKLKPLQDNKISISEIVRTGWGESRALHIGNFKRQ